MVDGRVGSQSWGVEVAGFLPKKLQYSTIKPAGKSGGIFHLNTLLVIIKLIKLTQPDIAKTLLI